MAIPARSTICSGGDAIMAVFSPINEVDEGILRNALFRQGGRVPSCERHVEPHVHLRDADRLCDLTAPHDREVFVDVRMDERIGVSFCFNRRGSIVLRRRRFLELFGRRVHLGLLTRRGLGVW